MVVSDILRATDHLSVPFVQNLLYLLIVSALLESLTLIWGPAKDASLPHFVKRSQLTHANSLSLIAVYGPWPLASLVFVGRSSPAHSSAKRAVLPDMLDEQPRGILSLGGRPYVRILRVHDLDFVDTILRPRDTKFDFSEAKRDLVEGLPFVRQAQTSASVAYRHRPQRSRLREACFRSVRDS